jgi:seryl-tRNA(Sec) selenium transferase
VTLSALAATLEEHLEGSLENIPFWRHALLSETDLANRAAAVAAVVGATVETGQSRVGAGSAPGTVIPSPVIRLHSRQDIYEKLLEEDRPVLARRESGDLILDLRAVEPEDDAEVAEATSRCL